MKTVPQGTEGPGLWPGLFRILQNRADRGGRDRGSNFWRICPKCDGEKCFLQGISTEKTAAGAGLPAEPVRGDGPDEQRNLRDAKLKRG